MLEYDLQDRVALQSEDNLCSDFYRNWGVFDAAIRYMGSVDRARGRRSVSSTHQGQGRHLPDMRCLEPLSVVLLMYRRRWCFSARAHVLGHQTDQRHALLPRHR